MHTPITLKTETREFSGKGSARAARKSGLIPAIIYGFNKEDSISISAKDFQKEYLKGGIMSKILKLQVKDQEVSVIARDVQIHPVTDNPIHVDFQRVEEDKPIKVVVRLRAVNEQKSAAIKRGGVLNVVCKRAKFYCLPSELRSTIEVDVSKLKIGQSIHISDLELPAGLTPVDKTNFVILSIAGRSDDSSEGAEAA